MDIELHGLLNSTLKLVHSEHFYPETVRKSHTVSESTLTLGLSSGSMSSLTEGHWATAPHCLYSLLKLQIVLILHVRTGFASDSDQTYVSIKVYLPSSLVLN
jgi:hypothetical protein